VTAPPPVGAAVANGRPLDGPTQTTAIAAPPPPPPPVTIAASIPRRADGDATQVVTPLPPPELGSNGSRGRSPSPRVIVDPVLVEPVPASQTAGARGRFLGKVGAVRVTRIGAAVIGAAAVVAGVLVVAIGFSSSEVKRAPDAEHHDRTAMPELPPGPPQQPAASQAQPAAAPAAAPASAALEAPAPAPVASLPAEDQPIATAPSHTTRPARLRARTASASSAGASAAHDSGRTSKAAGQPRKPARSLAYDPDALFLKKPESRRP
jgi:hypothetical protein